MVGPDYQGTPVQPADPQPASSQGAPVQPEPPQPASAQSAPAQSSPAQSVPATVERHKLHHSFIWLQGINVIPLALVVSVVSLVPPLTAILNDTGVLPPASATAISLVLTIITTLVLCGITIAISAVSYRYIWYEFTPGEFSFYSGIFNKKHAHVPYQRIQSVNQKTSLIQRLVGVCSVVIDTAGGSSNTAISLRSVQREEAERIRREIFLRKKLLDSGMTAQEVHAEMARLGDGVRLQAEALINAGVPVPPAGVPSSGAYPPPASYSSPGTYPPPAVPAQPAAQTSVAAGAPAAPAQPTMQSPAVPAAAAPASNVLDMPAEVASDMRGIFGGLEVETGAVTYEIGLNNKELFLAALTGKTSFALVLAGVVVSIFSAISLVIDLRIVSDGMVDAATHAMASALSVPFVMLIVGIIVLVSIVIIWAASFLGTCLYYGGFKACRRGNRVEVGQGIISHNLTGMDIDRIQSITVTQSFFQRLLGYCTLSYGRVTAGTPEENEYSTASTQTTAQDKLVVHPFLKLDRVDEVVAGLTPEHQIEVKPDFPLPKKACRRALIRRVILQGFGFWLAVMVSLFWLGVSVVDDATWIEAGLAPAAVDTGITIAVVSLYALCVVSAIFEAIGALQWYKMSGFGFNNRYVVLVNGGYSRSIVVVPRNKIQISCVQRNPLQRAADVATVVVITAQGTSAKKETLIDAANDDAQRWLAWAIPRTSQTN